MVAAAAASASSSGQLGLHITGDLHGKYALLVSVATNIDTWTRDGEATGIRSSIANGEGEGGGEFAAFFPLENSPFPLSPLPPSSLTSSPD